MLLQQENAKSDIVPGSPGEEGSEVITVRISVYHKCVGEVLAV